MSLSFFAALPVSAAGIACRRPATIRRGPEMRQTLSIGSIFRISGRFDLIEHNKVVDSCRATPYFVFLKGKWLLDNVFYYQDVDLKTLLSRKGYWDLPE